MLLRSWHQIYGSLSSSLIFRTLYLAWLPISGSLVCLYSFGLHICSLKVCAIMTSTLGSWQYFMPPNSRGISDRLSCSVSVRQTMSYFFRLFLYQIWVYRWFSLISLLFLNVPYACLWLRLKRLVWRFSISPFAANFLALVPGRYTSRSSWLDTQIVLCFLAYTN